MATLANPALATKGRFGAYGGRYVPETLMAALEELEAAYELADADAAFHAELDDLLHHYCGRPTPLYFAKRLSETMRRSQNLPQARRPPPHRRAQDQQRPRPGPARPPHGQAAHHRRDRRRPARRRHRHRLRPASASSASSTWARKTCAARSSTSTACACSAPTYAASASGSATLKDAINEAMRDWVTNVRTTYYILGSRARRAPLPHHGAQLPPHHLASKPDGQFLEERRQPAPGRSSPAWVEDRTPSEPSTSSSPTSQRPGSSASKPEAAAPPSANTRPAFQPGWRRPSRRAPGNLLLRAPGTSYGQVSGTTHSVSAGLDYPSVGPEHAMLHDSGRAHLRLLLRRRGAQGRNRHPVPHRGHRPRPRELPTPSPRASAWPPRMGKGPDPDDQPERPRRQGHGHHGPRTEPRWSPR